MKRLHQANPLSILDNNYLFLAGYKDGTSEDKKITIENVKNSIPLQNDIINGNFIIWQRNNIFTNVVNGAYTADRFYYIKNGGMVHTVQRVLNPVLNFQYGLKALVTTPKLNLGNIDYSGIGHIIEGYNIKKYKNNYCTLGFWVSSSKTGTHCVSFQDITRNISYVTEYTINAINVWEYKTITFIFNPTLPLNDTNDVGIRINWSMGAGASYQSLVKDVWVSGTCFATSNQVNLNQTSDFLHLAGVSFNLGKIPVKNCDTDYYKILSACQRYYEKSYNTNVYPGTVTNNGAVVASHSRAGLYLIMQKAFMVEKRTTPTMKWYSNSSGTIDRVYNNTNAVDITINTTLFQGTHSTGIPIAATSQPVDIILSAFYTADAELTP